MSKKINNFVIALLIIIIALVVFLLVKNILPDNIFNSDKSDISNIVVDSLALQAIEDDTTSYGATHNQPITEEIIKSSEYTQGYTNLLPFYQKLHNLATTQKGKIRIAYFGDSMTDGDFIVQTIRKQYQDSFGGEGIGFVGITSLSAGARASISHKYSGNWSTQSFLKNNSPKYMFGIDGQVSFTNSDQSVWLQFIASKMEHLQELNNPTLLFGYSPKSNASITINTNNNSTTTVELNSSNILNSISLSENPVKNLKINFNNCSNIPFYGVNIDSNTGIYVDNFSMRGNSGLPLGTLDKDLMNAMDSLLHYDLIILHYGANLIGYKSTSYHWYENKMTDVVLHLKQCFPSANFMIISSSDKSSKYNMEMQTDKNVEPLVLSQNNYAKNTNCAFINLYQLMGGNGSMTEWVKETPSLANKDYTHFNARGSEKIGSLIYNELNRGYTEYKVLKQQNKVK